LYILAFINNEPPKLIRGAKHKKYIKYLYADGVVRNISVEIFFATFHSGKVGAINVAADRPVARDEVLLCYQSIIHNKQY